MFNVERMKGIMKTTNKITWFICQKVLVLALLLVSTLQVEAVDYKNTYQRTVNYPLPIISTQTSVMAPTATFHSTSAYAAQWSEKQSMLNEDGSVNGEAYLSGGSNIHGNMRKSGPGTPGGDLYPTTQQPLGDGLMIIVLLAFAYAGARRVRSLKYNKVQK